MFVRPLAKTKARTTSTIVPTGASKAGHPFPARPGGSLVEQAFLLQRTIGNQATLRLLAQRSTRRSGTEPGDQHEQTGRMIRISEPQLQRAGDGDGGCPERLSERPGQGQERLQTKPPYRPSSTKSCIQPASRSTQPPGGSWSNALAMISVRCGCIRMQRQPHRHRPWTPTPIRRDATSFLALAGIYRGRCRDSSCFPMS